MALALPACFSPSVSAGTDAEGAGTDAATGLVTSTGRDTDGDGDPTSGDATGATMTTGGGGADDTGPADGSDSTGAALGPTITLFTANGEDSALSVTVAGSILLEVEAEDEDGTVESAAFFRDGELLGMGTAAGSGAFELDFVASGEEENGSDVLEVVVTDDDGNTASAELAAEFQLPNGGLIEGWNFDNGLSASAYAIRPSRDGDEILWTGTAEIDGEGTLRVDRVQGDDWQSTQNADSSFGSDILQREDGTYLVAGSRIDGGDTSTGLFRFSASGTALGDSSINGAPTNGPANWALALEDDDSGRAYVLGTYAGAGSASYLLRLSDDLQVDWKRDVTGSNSTDGSPFTYDFDVRGDGQVAVVGSRPVGSDKLWVAIYDADGELVDQLTLNSEFDTSIGYDVAWFEDGGLVVSGTYNEGDGWSRFVRAYTEDLLEDWTQTGPANDDFAQAVDTDAFGRVVVGSTETCSLNVEDALFDSCRLVLRSYTRDGQLRWQHQAEGGDAEFNGPVIFLPGFKADVETDRFGYVYLSAQHRLPTMPGDERSEWWAEKHHP